MTQLQLFDSTDYITERSPTVQAVNLTLYDVSGGPIPQSIIDALVKEAQRLARTDIQFALDVKYV
jgi:hypothetical protein